MKTSSFIGTRAIHTDRLKNWAHLITVSEIIFHFPSLEKKRKSLRPSFHCVVNMNVPLKLLVILQWRLSVYPFKLCKQIKLLQQYFLKSANQIDFIDVLSFPFRCSFKLRRLQLQAWHFEALSSLCDCIAVRKNKKIISIELISLSISSSRNYSKPIPRICWKFQEGGGGGGEISKARFLKGKYESTKTGIFARDGRGVWIFSGTMH